VRFQQNVETNVGDPTKAKGQSLLEYCKTWTLPGPNVKARHLDTPVSPTPSIAYHLTPGCSIDKIKSLALEATQQFYT